MTINGLTIRLNSQLLIDKNITIDATSLPDGVTIDADGDVTNYRVFKIESGTTTLFRNLTLTGGYSNNGIGTDFHGGAISISGEDASGDVNPATLTLESCTLHGNRAVNGGGAIYTSNNVTLTLQDCKAFDNNATFGGFIFASAANSEGMALSFNSCFIHENTTTRDGGAFKFSSVNGSSTMELNACTVSNNTAGFSGGGFDIDGGFSTGLTSDVQIYLTSCTIAGNTTLAGNGAGINVDSSSNLNGEVGDPNVTLTLDACTITENVANSSAVP